MVIGSRVLRLDEATSTNDVAKKLGKEGEKEGLVVIARRQTEGRGRMGRSWSSPEGGLYLSVLLRPDMRGHDVLRMTVHSCVPVAEAIEEVTGVRVGLKWPNDLMLGGKKVGGILVDGVSRGTRLDFAVLGIGINVNAPAESMGEEGATSLKDETGKDIDMVELTQAIIRNLDRFYDSLKKDELDEDEYVSRSCILGRQVEARVGKETFRGKALYLSPDGALVLRSEDGLVLRLSWVNETSIRATNNEGLAGTSLIKD